MPTVSLGRGDSSDRSALEPPGWSYVGCCYPRSFTNTSNGSLFSGDIAVSFWGGQTPLGGVFRSTDGGASWTAVGLATTPIYAITSAASDHLFAGSASAGIFRSTDGTTWTQVNATVTNPVTSLVVNSAGRVFAGVFGDGILGSDDDGISWSPVNSGLPNLLVEAVAASPTGFIFVGTPSGVFRSATSTVTASAMAP